MVDSFVRAARKRAGLTQDQLAAEAGVLQSTISNVEAGQHVPRPSTARALSLAFARRGIRAPADAILSNAHELHRAARATRRERAATELDASIKALRGLPLGKLASLETTASGPSRDLVHAILVEKARDLAPEQAEGLGPKVAAKAAGGDATAACLAAALKEAGHLDVETVPAGDAWSRRRAAKPPVVRDAFGRPRRDREGRVVREGTR